MFTLRIYTAEKVVRSVPILEGDPGLLEEAADLFGGATVLASEGLWLDDDFRLVTEPAVVVEVIGEDRRELWAYAELFARIAKVVYGESAVLATVHEVDSRML